MKRNIKLIECPRDAMQGLHNFVPTTQKVDYINLLLKVGFDVIDFGSFVSPKFIPQMADTVDVLKKLDLSSSKSKLLAIVANVRGAEDAKHYEQISYLGYPFSISETFQLRNTNATIEESMFRVDEIKNICDKSNKELVIYISMGFGNPYGDEYNNEIVEFWVDKIVSKGIRTINLSDTIGIARKSVIEELYQKLIPRYPHIEFGAHFHTTANQWREKVEAAYDSGCRRFDGAIHGFGGCPMAKDDLTGNMPTENIIQFLLEKHNEIQGFNLELFAQAGFEANKIML